MAADLRNRHHNQHPNLGFHNHGSQCGPSAPGSRLDADHPENGVLIPRRNTPLHGEPGRDLQDQALEDHKTHLDATIRANRFSKNDLRTSAPVVRTRWCRSACAECLVAA